jgi:hypothetical protein
MKVLAVILLAFGFVAAMVALGFVAALKFGPPSSSQKMQVIYGQSVEGEQRQGLHTNDFIHQVWDSGLVPHGMIAYGHLLVGRFHLAVHGRQGPEATQGR